PVATALFVERVRGAGGSRRVLRGLADIELAVRVGIAADVGDRTDIGIRVGDRDVGQRDVAGGVNADRINDHVPSAVGTGEAVSPLAAGDRRHVLLDVEAGRVDQRRFG